MPGKRPEPLPKPERKRPGPKAKLKSEVETAKPAEEPEYDPEVIANAHLTMDEDFYVCSVCKMKFKQPGNARRHIVTVHRNEKPHDCLKCGAKFGRKVRNSFSFQPLTKSRRLSVGFHYLPNRNICQKAKEKSRVQQSRKSTERCWRLFARPLLCK